ncbi:MAG: FtsL-like putative cell division protein [Bacteroidia bacterium]|nr:FtsL-like putative cell division protein [Bacteroidia bacterium]MDW8088958.1 FtsL-like putative cell division protein [Bacteroidia bacterium]
MKRWVFLGLAQHLGVWLYALLWIILYVASQYRAEQKIRRLHVLRRALSEKRAEYLQLNASVSQKRSYSALRPKLDSLNLFLPREAPIQVSYE